MLSGLVLMEFLLLGESFKVFTSLRFCDREFNPEKSAKQLWLPNQVQSVWCNLHRSLSEKQAQTHCNTQTEIYSKLTVTGRLEPQACHTEHEIWPNHTQNSSQVLLTVPDDFLPGNGLYYKGISWGMRRSSKPSQ